MQQLGWATCQRLSPNPDTLFYKFSNDVPVHRLFLDLRCDERSTPTHPVPSVWHASSRYTDSTNLPYPRLYISSMTTFIPRSKQFRLRQQRYLDIDIHIFVSLREPFVPPSMCLFFHPSFLLLPQFLDPHLPSPLSTPVTLLSPSPPPDVVLKLLVSN